MQDNTSNIEMTGMETTSSQAMRDHTSSPVQSPSSEDSHHGEIITNLQRLFQELREIEELQEQVLLDNDSDEECCSPGCYLLCSVPVFISLFLVVSLILYNVSKHQKPVITMKSITFDQFSVSLGSDLSGLETYMASVNSTVKFTYRNTATLFRARVTMSKPLNLNYSELTLATGNMNDFDQSKKSQRMVAVEVSGNQIPMYGAGASFIGYGGKPVPLNLGFAVHSRGYVLGSLVKPQFDRNIYCSVIFDPKKLKVPLSLHNSCTHK